MMSSKLWRHGENWPQRFDLSLPLYDLSLDIMVPGVWQIFGADCAVILRYCKSKLDKKCRSYLTLKHSRILNLQFAQGAGKGAFNQNQVLPILRGWSQMVLSGFKQKNQIHDIQLHKCVEIYLILALKGITKVVLTIWKRHP